MLTIQLTSFPYTVGNKFNWRGTVEDPVLFLLSFARIFSPLELHEIDPNDSLSHSLSDSLSDSLAACYCHQRAATVGANREIVFFCPTIFQLPGYRASRIPD